MRAPAATSTRSTSTTSSPARSGCRAASCTACGRWRSAPAPRATGSSCSRSPSSSAAWACPSGRSPSPPRPTGPSRPCRARIASSGAARWCGAVLRIPGVLTPRQEQLLGKVVDGFSETGQPVGSKALAADPDVEYGPSTIRNELAVLEEQGLLAHPHTSAGRVPTDAGYRYLVDNLLPARREGRSELQLSLVRREVDEAMRVTTETLSQVTNLLAIVSAPPIATTTLRHVEVLPLQPQVLMIVVITSTGGVSKRVFTFDRAIDAGLADWAASYLNEQLVGMGVGARMIGARLNDAGLHP